MSYYDLTGNLRVIPEKPRCSCDSCRMKAEEKAKLIPQKSFGCSTIFWAAIIAFTLLSVAEKFI